MTNLKKIILIIVFASSILVLVILKTYFIKESAIETYRVPNMNWSEASRRIDDCQLNDVIIGMGDHGVVARFLDGQSFMLVDWPGGIILNKVVKEAEGKCGRSMGVGIE